jgi:hypothetical protein
MTYKEQREQEKARYELSKLTGRGFLTCTNAWTECRRQLDDSALECVPNSRGRVHTQFAWAKAGLVMRTSMGARHVPPVSGYAGSA